MVKAADRFYNMQVSLLKDGRVYTEKVAITNVWQKDSGTFLGFYFHNVKKSLIYDSAFVRDIWDLNCDKVYADVDEFIADFYSDTDTEIEKNKQSKPDDSILSSVKNDVVILLFMARGLEYTNIIKEKIIFSYIQNRVKAASNLSEQYLHNFIKGINVSQKDFYVALKQLKSKKPKDAEFLLKEIVKLCLSDGQIHYNERMYLADIVQTLRLEGMKIPKNLF
jgi:hypothetical protein